jgi:hypothetical protein
MNHRATIGGCTNDELIAQATEAGRRYRRAVRRGDFRSAEHAWDSGDHGVGYPYMSAADYPAARAAFIRSAR